MSKGLYFGAITRRCHSVLYERDHAIVPFVWPVDISRVKCTFINFDNKTVLFMCKTFYQCNPQWLVCICCVREVHDTVILESFAWIVVKLANLADYNSDTVRRWVESNPTPNLQNNNIEIVAPKLFKNNLNNNTIGFEQTFWKKHKEDNMPMLLQQPSHVLLSSHEADQPLDFTMSKFKTKTATTVASHLKQFNDLAAHQHMMLLQNNGVYFNRSNNNKSFTRGSSPSHSSSSDDDGPPEGSPRSPPPSPVALRGDGK